MDSQKSDDIFCNGDNLRKRKELLGTASDVSSNTACTVTENYNALSESDEADNEVQRLTTLSFHSLSCPEEQYLDIHQSSYRTASRLSHSLSEDSPTMNRRPTYNDLFATDFPCNVQDNLTFAVSNATPELNISDTGKDTFECVDVALENSDRRIDCSKKTVPKRQILLKRKEKHNINFCTAAYSTAHQPVSLAMKKTHLQNNNVDVTGSFRFTKDTENKEKVLRSASLDDSTINSRCASRLVTNVLVKKMQFEQRLRMEQQLAKDISLVQSVYAKHNQRCVEDMPSSLSKLERNCSAQDLQNNSLEQAHSKYVSQDSPTFFRKSIGVALDTPLRDNIYTLNNAFNEHNTCLTSEQVGEIRTFHNYTNGMQWNSGDTRVPAEEKRNGPTETESQVKSQQLGCKPFDGTREMVKPWLGLPQRTANPYSHVLSGDTKRDSRPENILPSTSVFTSKTPQIKLMPQVNIYQKNNTFSICRLITLKQKSDVRASLAMQNSELLSPVVVSSVSPFCNESTNIGKVPQNDTGKANEDSNTSNPWLHQIRDVKKRMKDNYSLSFNRSGSITDQPSCTQESIIAEVSDSSQKTSAPDLPPFIQSKAICRKEGFQNESCLHGKQKYSNLDRVDTLQMSQLTMQDEEKHYNQPSTSVNTQTKILTDVEYGALNKPLTENITSPFSADNIQMFHKKEIPIGKVHNGLTMKSQISELNNTVKTAAKVTPKKSHLNFRVNSTPSLYPNNPEFGNSTAKVNLALQVKGDPQSPCLHDNSFHNSQEDLTSARQDSIITSADLNKETDRTSRSNSNHSNTPEPILQRWVSPDCYKDIKTELSGQSNVFTKTKTATVQESENVASSSLHSENTNKLHEPSSPIGNCESIQHLITSQIQSTVPRSQKASTYMTVNDTIRTIVEQDLDENKRHDATLQLDNHAIFPVELGPCHRMHSSIIAGYNEKVKSPCDSSITSIASVQAQHQEENGYVLSKRQNNKEQASSPSQPRNTPYLTIPFQEQKPVMDIPFASTHPKSSTASSTASLTSNYEFAQTDSELLQSNKSGKDLQEISKEKSLSGEPFQDVKTHQKQSWLGPGKSSNCCAQTSDEAISCSTSDSSSGISSVHHPQMQRKMLIDPESGKCYYIEPPRHPQLKILYDPETGQYIEVLIPSLPLVPHCGLYQAQVSPLVLSPGSYGSSCLQYLGFPGFPPPVTTPPVLPTLQNQQNRLEHQSISGNLNPIPKQEMHVNYHDNNLSERLYYIPTGMTSSPAPSQSLFSQASSCSPKMSEKDTFYRMPFHQTQN